MKILITGSSGLVGTALTEKLRKAGHEVIRMVRSPTPGEGTIILWKPDSADSVDSHQLEGLDAVIHLAGESVAEGRWTPDKKARLLNSRVQSTNLLAKTLGALNSPPRTFLCASAIGYYGDTQGTWVDETAPPGEGFMASVCQDWEAATQSAAEAGIRVAHLRFGIVLSTEGGALQKMLPPFKFGLGGPLGRGDQYMSWISLDDTVHAIQFILNTSTLEGPINIVSPNPVSNKIFSSTLGRALKRPAIFPLPICMARLILGREKADALLFSSTRVRPKRLQDAGFEFKHLLLEDALNQLLVPV